MRTDSLRKQRCRRGQTESLHLCAGEDRTRTPPQASAPLERTTPEPKSTGRCCLVQRPASTKAAGKKKIAVHPNRSSPTPSIAGRESPLFPSPPPQTPRKRE